MSRINAQKKEIVIRVNGYKYSSYYGAVTANLNGILVRDSGQSVTVP